MDNSKSKALAKKMSNGRKIVTPHDEPEATVQKGKTAEEAYAIKDAARKHASAHMFRR